jgi:hypothetical protein
MGIYMFDQKGKGVRYESGLRNKAIQLHNMSAQAQQTRVLLSCRRKTCESVVVSELQLPGEINGPLRIRAKVWELLAAADAQEYQTSHRSDGLPASLRAR